MASADKTVAESQQLEEQEPTLKERIETAAYVAYGQHNLVTKDGEPDQEALIRKIFDIVSEAIVEKPSERAKMVVTRSQFMGQIFTSVPGPADWIEQDDPELAEGLYKALDSDIWRLLNVNPDGPIQGMLNGEVGMLLCRTNRTRSREAGAYITRNRKCLYEDYSAGARSAVENAVNRHAALMAQAINRVPEHAGAFSREFDGTTRIAVNSGQGIVRGALEAGSQSVDDTGSDDGEE